MKTPAPNPCGTCPYRLDVPPGIWDRSEYQKLPAYDGPTAEQPPRVFLCHQQDGRICAGWAGCHDMAESLGLRLATARGALSAEDMRTTLEYRTGTPLFPSGLAACLHGLKGCLSGPGRAARRAIRKLEARRRRRASN